MKHLRKLSSLLLAVFMVLAMAATSVFAVEEDTYTIQVASGDTHTYEVYQIFTGKFTETEEGTVLTEVKWGANGTEKAGTDVDENILTMLQELNEKSDTDKLSLITTYVNIDSDSSNPISTVSAKNPLTVEAGYYLMKDVDAEIEGEEDTFSLYIVEVAGNVTIKRKADTPSMIKKVKEKNDSTGDISDWQDASDYDISDQVPYMIQTTIVDHYDDYDQYYLSFTDKMDEGLTFNNDIIVLIDNEEVDNSEGVYTVTPAEHGFTLEFTDLKKTGAHAKSVVEVQYSAKLNEKAVIGSAGNKNTAWMEFSNNPNGAGKGKTKSDTVVTFTYETVINKIEMVTDEEGNEVKKALSGATFQLEKYDAAEGKWNPLTLVEGADGTTFTFTGLDAGQYRITEVNPPAGYNKIAGAITFTVTSTWGEENEEPANLQLLSLEAKDDSGNYTFTTEQVEGSLDPTGRLLVDIENKKGSTLPSTGGMGTTILYTVGGIMVAAAAVLFITKNRMQTNK